MTMPTIIERQRHTHRVNGRFAKRQGEARARYQASRDDDPLLAELDRSYDDTRMPTPPQPWRGVHIDDDGRLRLGESEPVERETWTDWRAVGLVLFVIAVLAAGAWSAWA